MSSNPNPVLQNLRHLTQRFDNLGERMNDFSRLQAEGQEPDPSEFVDLLKKQSVTHTALNAQFGLLQKPLKTVLNETR